MRTEILKLSLKELRKKKLFFLLLLLVCIVAMYTVLSSITNAASTAYQKMIFESYIGYDLNTILHLDYQYTEETEEFAEILDKYRNYIATLDGVSTVGMLDVAGVNFIELKASEEYQDANAKVIAGSIYADHPARAQLLSVDETLLNLVNGGISSYVEPSEGYLPIYASEIFRNALPLGSILTDERTGDQYEIVGFIPIGSKWVDENDPIRFPLVSMDGWFIAPFTEGSKTDIMTQLSCLHNTYILLSEDANIDYLKQAIIAYPEQHQFKASAYTLSEEYDMYRKETQAFTVRQIGLAVLISIMAVCSIEQYSLQTLY